MGSVLAIGPSPETGDRAERANIDDCGGGLSGPPPAIRAARCLSGSGPYVEIPLPVRLDFRDPLEVVAIGAVAKRGPPDLLYATTLVSIF